MFEKELAFYEKNKQNLRAKYPGKRVVIMGDKIVGAYNSAEEAYHEMIKVHLLGTFMIHSVPKHVEAEIEKLPSFVM